jgi:S-disulfanyl-L-cysteine oxidoreductase SoxD
MSSRLQILVLLSAALLRAQAPAAKTVRDGVYSGAQAARGESAFGMNCAKCHEGADVDGPPLTGDPFIDRWREDNLVSLFTFIRTKMPQDAPGKLTESAYLDILAYLLQRNGNPAGPAELSSASLASTLLVGPDGPKPLPTNALVRVVGCLTPGTGNTWTVARAADAERTREGDQTTPDELKSAAAKPLGTRTFRLQNLAELQPPVDPGGWKGHKVQAKGVLIRQTNNDRINVISLMTVASDCSQ